MDPTEPRFTKTADGTHIAYFVMGDKPVDLVYAFGYMSNIDADGDVPFHAAFRQRLASFSRLILFDRRGTGLSDREGLADANALEAGMDDIRARDKPRTQRGHPLVLENNGVRVGYRRSRSVVMTSRSMPCPTRWDASVFAMLVAGGARYVPRTT